MLANKKCVVSEAGGADGVLEDFAQRATVYEERGNIARMCKLLVEQVETRRILANGGFAAFLNEPLFFTTVEQALVESIA